MEERGGGREEGVLPRAKLPLLKLMTCAPSACCCSSTFLQAWPGLAAFLAVVVPSIQQRPSSFLVSSDSCLLSKRGCLNSLLILQGKEGGLNSMTIMGPYMGIWAYTHAGNTDGFS